MDYILETAITIDYEGGVTLVDTTKRSMATYLLRRGFTETTAPGSHPYRRFRRETVSVAFPKATGRVMPEKTKLALKTASAKAKLGAK